MKKWMIALAALMLLLIPNVKMARAGQGDVVLKNCRECNQVTPGYVYAIIDSSDTYHEFTFCCGNCGMYTSFLESHSGGGATCTREGKCDICDRSYHTDHNWGAWTKADENQHVSTCQNSGCNQTQSGEHTGGYATCSKEGTCTICYGSYKDSDNHTGPYTYAYAPSASSVTQHTVTETCTGCGKTSCTYDEAHSLVSHDAQAPTCMEGGWDAYLACKYCTYSSYSAINPDPNAHVGTPTTTYVKTSETQHTAKITYAECKHTVDGESTAHTETTAATCVAGAYCAVCKSNYGDPDPDAHDLVQHEAQAPTCFRVGWTAYEACQREGCGYTTYKELPRLVHWYAEWTPNADATHTAACRQGCRYDGNVPCTLFTYQLNSADQAVEVTICPVCGEVSDGTRLMLTEAAADGKALPAGEVVVRMGTLAGGETVISVAFEIGGRLTQPAGQVKITLPAELLAGYTLSLLSEDGTETELTDVQEASFVLDFDANPSPVRVIRLVPAA